MNKITIATIVTISLAIFGMAYTNQAQAFWGGGYCSENNSCGRHWDYNDNYNNPQQGNYHDAYLNVAPNGFSCYGESRCVSGWNTAIVQAQQDLTAGYTQAQTDCPGGHTDAYCSGYTQGYPYAWNLDINQQQSSVQKQQCNIINSPGGTCNQEQSNNQGQSTSP